MKSIKSLKGIKSIKIKIWAAILSVTILVILCIWISQVILLEEFYLAQKMKDIQSTTQEILRMISSQTNTEDFTEQLKTIAAQKNYCIKISDISGTSMINAVPEGSANILMDENFVRRPILERLLNSNQTYYLEGTYPLEYEIDTSDYDRDTTDRNAPYLDESWYTIEGYVHDMDNNPVEGAIVKLTDQTDKIEMAEPYITAADGYYIFDGLEDGIYHVHVIYRDKVEHIYEVDTGTGDITDISPEEPDPVEENINVTITNFSRGTVTEPEDGWYEGENSFQLASELALRVFLAEDDGSFTELSCVNLGGDIYEFTAYLEDGDEIVVLTVGDADLDGHVRVTDASRIAQYMVGLYELDVYQELAADADCDGRVRVTDASRVARYMVGLYDLVWNLR